ncbi:MAG: ABC transporter substrate-binding protein [Patescibacteria group bacterium]
MNKNSWILLGVVAVLVAAIVLAQVNTQDRTKQQEALEVAVLLPLSTDFAWWGESIQHSIEMAQTLGYGKNVKFIYGDTKCNIKDAVNATESIKALHPSVHIFIVGCDDDLKAMMPILDKNKDLAFIVGLSGADLYETDFPIINLAYRLETEATAAASFASKELGVKTLGIIANNTNFGGVLSTSIEKYFQNIGGTTTIERIKYNDPNPETAVLKVLQGKPDAVYIHNDIPTIAAILKRLNQMGYTGKRIVYYGGRDQSLIDAAGAAAEGLYVPWPISDATSTIRERFVTSFKETYKKDPFITAYFMYDGIMLLDEASKSCGNNVRCIESYFYNKKDFIGTLGKLMCQPNGEVDRSFYFEQVRNGKFSPVE